MFSRLHGLRDILLLGRARSIELKSDFEGALKFLEGRSFRSSNGRAFAKLYRAKLLVVTHHPTAKVEVAHLTRIVGSLDERMREATYFRAYAAYLNGVMANDDSLIRSSCDALAREDVIALIRSCLAYFPPAELDRS